MNLFRRGLRAKDDGLLASSAEAETKLIY